VLTSALILPLPAGDAISTRSVRMRASLGGTFWPKAKSGLNAASRPAAVVPLMAAKRADPSRNPRRSIAPCTYWSNSFITSGWKSAAVRRAGLGWFIGVYSLGR